MSGSRIGGLNIIKCQFFSKIIEYNFRFFKKKSLPVCVGVDINRLILNFMWKVRRPKIGLKSH